MRFLVVALAALHIAAQAAAAPALAKDQRIKVKGEFSAQKIRALSIHLKDAADRDFEIVGRVEALDDEGRIRVHGIWAEIGEDELSRRARQQWRRLEVGDWVKVEGDWSKDGALVADAFERPRKKRRVDSVEGLLSKPRTSKGPWQVGPFLLEASVQTEWKGFK